MTVPIPSGVFEEVQDPLPPARSAAVGGRVAVHRLVPPTLNVTVPLGTVPAGVPKPTTVTEYFTGWPAAAETDDMDSWVVVVVVAVCDRSPAQRLSPARRDLRRWRGSRLSGGTYSSTDTQITDCAPRRGTHGMLGPFDVDRPMTGGRAVR